MTRYAEAQRPRGAGPPRRAPTAHPGLSLSWLRAAEPRVPELPVLQE